MYRDTYRIATPRIVPALLKTHSTADRDRYVPLKSSPIDQIRELIRARDGLDQLSVLNREEIQDILDYVCTY